MQLTSSLSASGGVNALQDMIGGHLTACISPIGTLLPSVQFGAVRALATTAPRRSIMLPHVPTFGEAGFPMLESVERLGVLVPVRTPPEVVGC